jgi:hypothetical protein
LSTLHGASFCPIRAQVASLNRWADPVNSWTRGVQPACRANDSGGAPTGALSTAPTIGATTTASPAVASCPYGAKTVGFYGRAGNVVDGLGLRCLSGGVITYGPYVGYNGGGAISATVDCPVSTVLVGFVGGAASFFGGFNVTALYAICDYLGASTLGSAPGSGGGPKTTYRASAAHGPVRLSVLVSRALSPPRAWYYGIGDLHVATRCSHSARVPGTIIATRLRASQKPHFSFTSGGGGFRISGALFGALARPKVSATVTVLKGACAGEVVRFTAVKSHAHA